VTRPGGDTEQLERLVRRLADAIPGYPHQLALCARLSAQLEKRMAEAANAALRPLRLTYVLYQAMMIMRGAEEGGIAPGEIAQLTGERPNNVTHICNELETRNLITRSPARGDRRRVQVALTAAGRRLLARAQPLIWARWRRRFEGFGARELAAMPDLLRRQLHNLDQSGDAEPR
jgi:MarR family transcriptional regulator, negative regulator of the multidrug operon emrRAB